MGEGKLSRCSDERSVRVAVTVTHTLALHHTHFVMKRAIDKRRFPQPSSIQRHALTEAEVMQLVEGVLASLRARDTQV